MSATFIRGCRFSSLLLPPTGLEAEDRVALENGKASGWKKLAFWNRSIQEIKTLLRNTHIGHLHGWETNSSAKILVF